MYYIYYNDGVKNHYLDAKCKKFVTKDKCGLWKTEIAAENVIKTIRKSKKNIDAEIRASLAVGDIDADLYNMDKTVSDCKKEISSLDSISKTVTREIVSSLIKKENETKTDFSLHSVPFLNESENKKAYKKKAKEATNPENINYSRDDILFLNFCKDVSSLELGDEYLKQYNKDEECKETEDKFTSEEDRMLTNINNMKVDIIPDDTIMTLKKFINISRNAVKYKKKLCDELSICDKKITDILHYIENNDFSKDEGYRISLVLKRIRMKRRIIKNQYNIMSVFLEEYPKTSKRLENTIYCAENYNNYTPRIYTENTFFSCAQNELMEGTDE